jgi:hypothetical protein
MAVIGEANMDAPSESVSAGIPRARKSRMELMALASGPASRMRMLSMHRAGEPERIARP